MPFVKGPSGNPAGRPRGCKYKINGNFDLKLLESGDYLADKLFKLFADGNATALRLVTQRLSPVTKGRPIEIDLPPLKSPADRPAAMEVINRALCEGEITIAEASELIGYIDKALGFDHAAVAKAQLVALMREVISLRSELAVMHARLDAELGVDNINVESSAEGSPADLGDAAKIAATVDNINAESTIDVTAIDAPAAPRDATTTPANIRENTGTETDRFIHDPQAPYGTRPVPMTISEDVAALTRELEQLYAEAPDAADAAGQMLGERQRHAA